MATQRVDYGRNFYPTTLTQLRKDALQTKIESGEFSYAQVRAVCAGGYMALKLLGGAENGSLEGVLSTHKTFIGEHAQVFADTEVDENKISSIIKAIGIYIDSYEPPEDIRDKIFLKVLRRVSSLGPNANLVQVVGEMIHRQIVLDELGRSFRETPIRRRGRNNEEVPEDHISVFSMEEEGYDEVEEDTWNSILDKIDLLSNPQHQEIIKALLYNSDSIGQYSTRDKEAARVAFMKVVGYRDVVEKQEREESAREYFPVRQTMANLQEVLSSSNAATLRDFFGLLEHAKLTTEEYIATLFYTGFYHAEEHSRIFSLNEGTRITLLQNTFSKAVEKMQQSRNKNLQNPSIGEIDYRMKELEGSYALRTGRKERISLPSDMVGRIEYLGNLIGERSEEEIDAKIANTDQRILISALRDWRSIHPKEQINHNELHRISATSDYGYKKTNWALSADVVRIIDKLLDPTPLHEGGRRLVANSYQARLIKYASDREKILPLLSSLRIQGRPDDPIYQQVFDFVTTPNEHGQHPRVNFKDLSDNFGVHARILDQLLIICGGEITDKQMRESRSLVLRVIGMRLGVDPEVYTSSNSGWQREVKASLQQAIRTKGSILGEKLNCPFEYLQEIAK